MAETHPNLIMRLPRVYAGMLGLGQVLVLVILWFFFEMGVVTGLLLSCLVVVAGALVWWWSIGRDVDHIPAWCVFIIKWERQIRPPVAMKKSETPPYDEALTPQEVGKRLRVDPRTVRKYAEDLGGIKIGPSIWRFFEHNIRRISENAFVRSIETRRSQALASSSKTRREDSGNQIFRKQRKGEAKSNSVGEQEKNRIADQNGLKERARNLGLDC